MKILHIATQAPGRISGGEIGTLQFSYALTQIGDKVNYVGPTINDKDIYNLYDNIMYLEERLNISQKIWTLFNVQFDRKFLSWKHIRIDFDKYDLIFIEFAKLNYILKDIIRSKYKGKVIIRAHNVEYDFFKVNLNSHRTPMTVLKYVCSKRRECYMIKNADVVLAITELDKKRIMELYNVSESKIKVCPVGVNSSMAKPMAKIISNKKLNCLITGTLSFGPNYDGIIWFLKNVYPSVRDVINLNIAGSNPNDEIEKLCRENKINLIKSPQSMSPFFEECDFVIVPIFKGGGMKVKIAEAMSYAKPILTTSHGAIGYQLLNEVNGYVADTKEGFIQSILTYCFLSENEKKNIINNEWELYSQNYCVEAIRNKLEELINDID